MLNVCFFFFFSPRSCSVASPILTLLTPLLLSPPSGWMDERFHSCDVPPPESKRSGDQTRDHSEDGQKAEALDGSSAGRTHLRGGDVHIYVQMNDTALGSRERERGRGKKKESMIILYIHTCIHTSAPSYLWYVFDFSRIPPCDLFGVLGQVCERFHPGRFRIDVSRGV